MEAHLTEMMVGGQRLPEPQLLHHHQTGAVRKGVVLVAVTKERFPCLLGTVHADPFPPQARAAFELLPPRFRSAQSQPHADERESLVDHIIRCYQHVALFESRVARPAGPSMRRVAFVRAGHPARRIDEHALHDR